MPGAHYFLYEVEKTENGWSLTVRARGIELGDEQFAERFTRSVMLERPTDHGKS